MSFLLLVLKKSLFSVLNRKFFILVAISILLSALVIFGLQHSLQYIIGSLTARPDPAYFLSNTGKIAHWLSDAGPIKIADLLFLCFVPLIACLFENKIASDIEKTSYPTLHPVHSSSLSTSIKHGITFSSILLVINILLLPIHLAPYISFVSFCLLNGYLFSKERFYTMASRYISTAQAEVIFKAYRWKFFWVGVAIVSLTQIIFIKLLVPFISIAIMIHSLQEIANQTKQKEIAS